METLSLDISSADLRAFCARWGVRELALFGSAVRPDFHPHSDVDILVTFDEEATPSLFDLVAMEGELEVLFGREVDLVEREAVEQSDNWIRRERILGSAKPIYTAQ